MCQLNNRDALDVQREILDTQRELLDIASGKKDPHLLELQRIEEQNIINKEVERLEQSKRSEIRKNFAAMIALTELSNESQVDEIFCEIAGDLLENNTFEFLHDREIIYREYFDNFIIANPNKAKVYIRLLQLFTAYVEKTKSIYEERLNEQDEKNRIANEKFYAEAKLKESNNALIDSFQTFFGILFTGLVVGLVIGIFTYMFQKVIFTTSPYPHDQMGQAFVDGFIFGFLLFIIPGSLWILSEVLNIFNRPN
jgi:F0F1-type ATP synthase assembly protein I